MTIAELKPIALEVLRGMEGADKAWIKQDAIEAAVSKVLVERGALKAGYILRTGTLREPLKALKAEGLVKLHSTIQFNGRRCVGDDFWRLVS